MIYKLSTEQEIDLLDQPETGMGYQIVEASRAGNYKREKFLILNSEIVIEIDRDKDENVRKVISEGTLSCNASANFITLNSMLVLNEKQFRNTVSESKNENE